LFKTDSTGDTIRNELTPIIKGGEVDTIILALDHDFKMGRHVQFQIGTTNGAVIVGTIIIGSSGESTSLSGGELGGGGGELGGDSGGGSSTS